MVAVHLSILDMILPKGINMKKSYRILRVTSFVYLLILSGCTFSPLAKKSAAFGSAASIVVRGSSNAYDTVQRATYDAGVSSLVLDFDHSGFDRTKIKPFLPEHDLQVRQQVLRGLQQYADDLADVASDHAFASVDQESVVLSQQLVTISSNADFKKIVPGVSDTEAKGLATAIDTLAKVLVERKRRKELPKIITKMQPVLDQICNLFDQDIGSKPINGRGGHGLRDQLWDEYDLLIGNQTDYISANKTRFTPSEKATEIAKLPDLVAKQQAADAALATTQTALRSLVATHRALLTPEQASTFKDRLQTLIADGQQIAAFYNKLQSK
jgi:hypothetical protein